MNKPARNVFLNGLLLLLVFLLPFSFPLTLASGDSVIMFPSEALLLLTTFVASLNFLFIEPLHKKILIHPVTILIALELCWNVLCSFYSHSVEVSVKRTIVNGLYVFVYYFTMAHFFLQYKNIARVYTLYSIGLVLVVLYTLYIHAGMGLKVATCSIVSRPFYNDHTIYGAILAFFIPITTFYVFTKEEKPLHSFVYLILLVVEICGLFFSYSRAAWLSLAIGGGCYFFIRLRYKFRWLALFGGLLLIVYLIAGKSVIENIIFSKAKSNHDDLTEHVQSVTNVNSDVSNAERINRWKCALRMFYDEPITGFGPGTYQFYYGPYQVKSEMTRISTYHGNKGHAHSEYLNRLSETGWPGCLLFISTAIAVFVTGWKIENQRQSSTSEVGLVRMCTIALVTFYVHGFFNGFLDVDKIAMPVYGAMAVVVLISIKPKKSSKNDVLK